MTEKERQIEDAKQEIAVGISGLIFIFAIVAVILAAGKDIMALKIIAALISLVAIGFIFDIRRGLKWLKELMRDAD